METSNLQTFLTVTATGSFTKAAEQSFLSAPAVMKQINKLEQELGVALFTRTSTGVTLTPAGKGFKGYAAHRQLRGLGLAPGPPASPGFHESVEAVNLKGSATQPLGRPWAKLGRGLVRNALFSVRT